MVQKAYRLLKEETSLTHKGKGYKGTCPSQLPFQKLQKRLDLSSQQSDFGLLNLILPILPFLVLAFVVSLGCLSLTYSLFPPLLAYKLLIREFPAEILQKSSPMLLITCLESVGGRQAQARQFFPEQLLCLNPLFLARILGLLLASVSTWGIMALPFPFPVSMADIPNSEEITPFV